MKPQYYRCGICDHWHSAAWNGDCREDAARFYIEDIDAKHGRDGWEEVIMPGSEDVSPSEGGARLTLAGFIRNHGITAEARRADSNPHAHEPTWDADHWRVTLHCGGRRLTIYFSMGKGHHGEPPTAADVLDSLASDSASIETARDFADWCGEYGYDTDSRSTRRTYTLCKRQAQRLQKFLGADAYNVLLYEVERE